MKLDKISPENVNKVLDSIRQDAIANGTADMSMEEIDEEIAAARKERRRK